MTFPAPWCEGEQRRQGPDVGHYQRLFLARAAAGLQQCRGRFRAPRPDLRLAHESGLQGQFRARRGGVVPENSSGTYPAVVYVHAKSGPKGISLSIAAYFRFESEAQLFEARFLFLLGLRVGLDVDTLSLPRPSCDPKGIFHVERPKSFRPACVRSEDCLRNNRLTVPVEVHEHNPSPPTRQGAHQTQTSGTTLPSFGPQSPHRSAAAASPAGEPPRYRRSCSRSRGV